MNGDALGARGHGVGTARPASGEVQGEVLPCFRAHRLNHDALALGHDAGLRRMSARSVILGAGAT